MNEMLQYQTELYTAIHHKQPYLANLFELQLELGKLCLCLYHHLYLPFALEQVEGKS